MTGFVLIEKNFFDINYNEYREIVVDPYLDDGVAKHMLQILNKQTKSLNNFLKKNEKQLGEDDIEALKDMTIQYTKLKDTLNLKLSMRLINLNLAVSPLFSSPETESKSELPEPQFDWELECDAASDVDSSVEIAQAGNLPPNICTIL